MRAERSVDGSTDRCSARDRRTAFRKELAMTEPRICHFPTSLHFLPSRGALCIV